MNRFKRFCYIIYVLASTFVLLALGLTCYGPWTQQALQLLYLKPYLIAFNCSLIISVFGLFVVLSRALFTRKVTRLTVETVDGGTISVTKEAIASQAAHIVEEDGTCIAHRVNVQISKVNTVAVQVDVLPKETVDVTRKGPELHGALEKGLATVCGSCVSGINLSFVKPQSFSSKENEVKTAIDEQEDTQTVSSSEQNNVQVSETYTLPKNTNDIRLSIPESEE